jgi:glycosyltransferase involved in cell wall biosynthesis
MSGAKCKPMNLTIVIPARNEAASLDNLLPEILRHQPTAEILVINDGSTDSTAEICQKHGARVITHPYSMGNGAAIKSGARAARGDITVFMDADGQHKPIDIARLLQKLEEGYEMIVGARSHTSQASWSRRFANSTYNRLASFMTGFKIEDLTSGFRAVRTRHFKKFLYLLPNGFSYPTTSTMAFFRSGLPVGYISIEAGKREGLSHIKIVRDGLRFLIIILKIGALFSPMRFFLPISAGLFILGTGYYGYTYLYWGRLTNMSALLFVSALLTFLIGILSEQISSLHYKHADDDQRRPIRPTLDKDK